MADIEVPNIIRERFEAAIKDEKLSDKKKEELWQAVVEEYMKDRYDSGEAVGIVSAQSISEPATQMTMRTYHFAGSAGIQVTLGLPRIMEVLDARRQPSTPMMTVYLDKSHNTNEKAKKIAADIAETKLSDIAVEETIDLMQLEIKIRISEDKIKALGLETDEIKEKVGTTKGVKSILRGSVLTITPDTENYSVKDLQKLKQKVLKTHLKGIKGITQALVKNENGKWVIYTLGSSLAKVFKIEGIDPYNTTTNDIHEIESVLGIEAARAAIMNESNKVLSDQGLDVDVRHVMIVADTMTFTGTIKAIGRYGVAGQKASVFARASFEETVKHLTKAALKGEKDKLDGIIENIMIGQVAPAGTGTVDLVAKPMKKSK